MRTLTTILVFLCISIPALVSAQPVITLCEKFTIGTVLKFQQCNTTGVYSGGTGASQTWNFASLTSMPDTTTETLVAPSATSYASTFPTSNIVEKYSDGTFVFINLTADSNYLTGFIDSIHNYTMLYANSMLFAVRPITYGTIATDTFTANFSSSSYNYTGKGVSTINADGYGTLMLPNGTHNNVLRLKITQTQTDTLIPSGSTSVTTTVSYVWFDSFRTSALLKIDSTQSGTFGSKTVQYLINESPSGIKEVGMPQAFRIYPNPAIAGELNIAAAHSGMLSIANTMGQVVKTVSISENQTTIPTSYLSAGLYYVTFQYEGYKQTVKLVIE